MKKIVVFVAVVAIVALWLVQPVSALPVSWTDWTEATVGNPGSATGVIPSTGITVSYTGDVAFAQLGTGTNYWTEGDPPPYTGNSLVDNPPTPAEMIALRYANTSNTITFSEYVKNPVMAIVSLGRSNLPVSYTFDTPFTVLSEGRGYWGDGWYSKDGNTLTGYELHAAIMFPGQISSIGWTVDIAEYWHGITVGVPQGEIPEPSTLLLLGTGLFGLASVCRRRVA